MSKADEIVDTLLDRTPDEQAVLYLTELGIVIESSQAYTVITPGMFEELYEMLGRAIKVRNRIMES